MTRRFAPLWVLVAFAAGWCALGGLPGAGADPPSRFLSLLAGHLIYVAVLVLLLEAPWRDRPGWLTVASAWPAATIVTLPLHHFAVGLGWADAVTATTVVGAFGALVAATWLGDRLALGGRSQGLVPLAAGAVLVLSPFALDGFLAGSHSPGTVARVMDASLGGSPPVMVAHEGLDFDLFKQEEIYRRFRVGERIFGCPGAAQARRRLLAWAAAVAAVGLLGLPLRAGVSRLLRKRPRCGQIDARSVPK